MSSASFILGDQPLGVTQLAALALAQSGHVEFGEQTKLPYLLAAA